MKHEKTRSLAWAKIRPVLFTVVLVKGVILGLALLTGCATTSAHTLSNNALCEHYTQAASKGDIGDAMTYLEEMAKRHHNGQMARQECEGEPQG
ncbi:hypothetical protein [Ferrimonas balearica]|uniref:hypothetical protein n=1 Tax=Ferrimonas balearica TaxID=44012 RepID=UPI001C998521|nr:hypothetical protein [Ferrimonas balearica]MBY5992347.1 hypothetical protein [Ferrimonas balearica]